jgi:hypothetical protein
VPASRFRCRRRAEASRFPVEPLSHSWLLTSSVRATGRALASAGGDRGVREDGTKELLAIEDGHRESTDSWAAVLRYLKRRDMNCLRNRVTKGAGSKKAALAMAYKLLKVTNDETTTDERVAA